MKATGGTSKGETPYTREGVAADLRADGRGRLDYRHLTLELALFAHTAGSARLSLGGTDVVVGVTAELAEPDAATPDEGRIVVSVGASAAMAEDELLALEAALQSLYAHNVAAAALRALCIVPGAQCWQLRAHAQLLVAEGWPLDALALAVNAALHNTRVPKDHLRVHAMGDVDELNSHIGLLLCEPLPEAVRELLVDVQHQLFNLGGELSMPGYALLKPEALLQLDNALEKVAVRNRLGTLDEQVRAVRDEALLVLVQLALEGAQVAAVDGAAECLEVGQRVPATRGQSI